MTTYLGDANTSEEVWGAAGQVADIWKVRKSDGTVLFYVDKDGLTNITGAPGPAGPAGAAGAGGVPSIANYIIYKSGSTYYAANGFTGATYTSNALFSTVLQACINSLSSTGGMIQLRNGTFDVGAEITVPANVNYTFQGTGATKLKLTAGGASGRDMFSLHTDSNVNLFDLEMDGNRSGQTLSNFMSGIDAQDADYIRADRCYIHDFTGDGIYIGNLTACNYFRSSGCRLDNNYRNGLSITGGRHMWFYDLAINGAGNQCIDLEPNSPSAELWDINFIGGDWQGADATYPPYNGGSGFFVSGQDIDRHGGIHVSNVDIHDNLAAAISYNGVSATGGLRDIIFEGGRWYNNGGASWFAQSQKGHTFHNVTAFNNGTAFWLQNATGYIKRGITFDGCKAYNNTGYGFRMGGVSGAPVEHCHIVNCEAWDDQTVKTQTYGMSLDGNYLTDCDIDHSKAWGNISGQIIALGTAGAITNSTGNFTGDNPVTVTASPMTYVNGPYPVLLSIRGGTVSSVTKAGVTVGAASPSTVVLGPRKTCVITYTSAPTISATVM